MPPLDLKGRDRAVQKYIREIAANCGPFWTISKKVGKEWCATSRGSARRGQGGGRAQDAADKDPARLAHAGPVREKCKPEGTGLRVKSCKRYAL